MAKLIKDQIKHCKDMSLYPVSINDIDLATAKQIVPTDVYLFLRWVITNDDVEADLVLLPMKGEFFVLPKICFTVLPMVGLSFPNTLV